MKILNIIFIGFLIGISFLIDNRLPLFLVVAVTYLWFLIKYPELALFISILVIISCFSMIDENFLRMPSFFRIRDIFFISIFLPFLIGIYSRDEKTKVVLGSPLAKGIYLIVAITIIQLFVTKLRFPEETLNSILRIGRRYLYYTFFFPATYILLDQGRLRRFLKLSVGAVVIFCLIYITQFLIGYNHRIFLYGRVERQILQGFTITRMYVMGALAATLVFQICFMVFSFCKKFNFKNILLTLLSGVQTLLTFGRAHILGVITGILFSIFYAKNKLKLKSLIKIIIILFFVLSMIEFSSKVFFSEKGNIITAIYARITSVHKAILNQDDTFAYRIRDSMGRIELIKKNPFFGIGFVHDESKLFISKRGYDEWLRSLDSGSITLLLDFGILGFLWLFIMSFIVLSRSRFIYDKTENEFYRAVVMGVLAFYFGRIFSFVTLTDFVSYDGIVIIMLSFALLETINYKIVNGRHGR